MYSVDLMVDEHALIKEGNEKIRKKAIDFMENDIPIDVFYTFIDIVRNFADKHHHGKEEKFLFKEMEKNLGEIGVALIKHGMIVEHELGRLYIMELEKSLDSYKAKPNLEDKIDIIGNIISYTKLLERHIAKEDELVYNYGLKNLAKEILEEVDKNSRQFEEDNKEIRIKYEKIIKEMD